MRTRQVTRDSGQRSGATKRTAQADRNVVSVGKNTALTNVRLGQRRALNVTWKIIFDQAVKQSIRIVDNHTQKSNEPSESEEEIFVYPVDTETGDEWSAPLPENGTILPLKNDTVAQTNLLSVKDYNKDQS